MIGAMYKLHKGDCEHCCRIYHYTLLHAGFGDYSYAYCDCLRNARNICLLK